MRLLLTNLRYCKFRVLAEFDWPESQDDLILRDAGRHQLFCDSMLRAVVLNPELSVNDVKVSHDVQDALAPIPADIHPQVVVPASVEDRLQRYVSVSVRHASVF